MNSISWLTEVLSVARRKKPASFIQRLLNLISEPQFIKFENILSEPNFFRIVGRTHYERWHSSLIGWLLDADGSHLVGDYSLKRFLMLLLDENCLRARNHAEHFLLRVLPTATFSEIEVAPNEHFSTETSISGVGRFDIFLTAKYSDNFDNKGTLNIIFELKINSKPNGKQSKKYADWIFENHTEDDNFLIYLTPQLLNDSKSTVGDERWYCLNYQLLNDKLLLPLLDHPNLNEKVKPFIIQYVKNLKNRYKGIKMAITDEEKRLALALYEKYSDVFDSIYDALASTGTIDFSTSDMEMNKGRATGRLAVKIDGKVFSDDTISHLFQRILKFIVEKKHILRLPLPWGTSTKRYIVSNKEPAKHPNDRTFFYPVKYQEYTIESHYSRDRGLKVVRDLCGKLELDFEVIET